MKRNYTIIPLSLLLLIAMVACSNKSKGNTDSEGKQPKSTVSVPQFDADSAYRYVKEQVDFGPRVPNTAAHKACGEYLAKKLEQFGATVYNQQVDLTAYDGTLLKARNIIGSYKPETKKRIVLLSHWDSRPWADADINGTLGISFGVLLLLFYYGIKVKGATGFVVELFTAPFGKHPALWAFNFLLNIIEYAAKFVSLGMRLFGNMYAGELVFFLIALLGGFALELGPLGGVSAGLGQVAAGLVWWLFHVLIVLLQAFIFMMLTLVYIGQAHSSH